MSAFHRGNMREYARRIARQKSAGSTGCFSGGGSYVDPLPVPRPIFNEPILDYTPEKIETSPPVFHSSPEPPKDAYYSNILGQTIAYEDVQRIRQFELLVPGVRLFNHIMFFIFGTSEAEEARIEQRIYRR
jgi:hypothetical protein